MVDKTEVNCSTSADTINVGGGVDGNNVDTTMEKREDNGKKIWRYLGNNYSLGYTLERPYPWRWTTPIVVSVFFLLSAVLAVINVPLSAVDNVQQLTYRPNDTLPRLPLANLVPSILQSQTASFAPQVLTVGDTIVLNGSTFNYTIVDAFDGVDSTPVSSFSYYNNPFSDGCDVEHMTVNLVRQMKNFSGAVLWFTNVSFNGTVVCQVPTQFHLTWSAQYDPGGSLLDNPVLIHTAPPENLADIPAYFAFDFLMRDYPEPCSRGMVNKLRSRTFSLPFTTMFRKGPTFPPDSDAALPQRPATGAIISLTALPCCDCVAVLAGTPFETASLLRPPCSSTSPGIILVNGGITVDDGVTSWSPGEITTPITVPDFFLSIQTLLGNMSPGSLDTPVSLSGLDAMWQNLFQAVYHLVRLDLGVILENQIYNSPEMYNQTILGVPSDVASAANSSRESTSNATLSAKWQKRVEFLQHSDRVPVMEYLRPVPRMKPLGSAITSVFVSTFAMLSAIWTVFSLIAGALARRRTGETPGRLLMRILGAQPKLMGVANQTRSRMMLARSPILLLNKRSIRHGKHPWTACASTWRK
ncbi:hypothetical protein DFH08DRAFT_803921 [Mycena albidolilacea]|uniref:Transmembrane protein n=1 Tax=Mycena albidolilacea TaxID=1033008 RepID=A0AAD7EWK5_9AGAR|nr:hypothetical protein DFH08DRAFT_803921 [Mycena albidolilacea]